MTYINKLQDTVRQARLEATEADDFLQELVIYLNGDKFALDTTVQVKDVLLRLEPVRNAVRKVLDTTDVVRDIKKGDRVRLKDGGRFADVARYAVVETVFPTVVDLNVETWEGRKQLWARRDAVEVLKEGETL